MLSKSFKSGCSGVGCLSNSLEKNTFEILTFDLWSNIFTHTRTHTHTLFLSLSLSVCMSLSLSLSIYIYIYIYIYINLSLLLSFSFPPTFSFFSPFLSHLFPPPLSLSLSIYLSIYLSLTLYLSIYVFQSLNCRIKVRIFSIRFDITTKQYFLLRFVSKTILFFFDDDICKIFLLAKVVGLLVYWHQ